MPLAILAVLIGIAVVMAKFVVVIRYPNDRNRQCVFLLGSSCHYSRLSIHKPAVVGRSHEGVFVYLKSRRKISFLVRRVPRVCPSVGGSSTSTDNERTQIGPATATTTTASALCACTHSTIHFCVIMCGYNCVRVSICLLLFGIVDGRYHARHYCCRYYYYYSTKQSS